MNTLIQRPTRTATGYRLGELAAEMGKGLSPRETEVLLCKAAGWTEKQAASALTCSVANITNITQSLLYKLRARRSTDALCHAFQRGIIHYSVIMLAVLMGTMPPHDNSMARNNHRVPLTVKIKTRTTRRPDEPESLES